MEIRLRSTGAVMTEGEFRAYQKANDGPTWEQTTDEVLDSLDADPVFDGPQAQPTRYQYAYRDGVEQVDGKWFSKWSVADMDEDARAAKDAEQAKAVRADRNQRLSDCDWTQLADAPVDRKSWAVYRKALRDLTKQDGFPWDINWPEQP